LDFDRLQPAYSLARRLRGKAGIVKVGSQLFTAEGPRAVRKLVELGFDIFLDLKFHDIPNTVAGAVSSAAALPGIRLLTVHTTGGAGMMSAAQRALGGAKDRPAILGVTVLTSMGLETLKEVGIAGTPASRALALAKLAKKAGLGGVVASAHETAAIRRACGRGFLIVVPGVRPADSSANDQSRVATPAEAIRAGADYLVVGRPITAAADPGKAAENIAKEIASAARRL
jgi:orotidine-5'-phosphate decarboxylase